MTVKQLPGRYTPDGSYYICSTDGEGNLVLISTSTDGPKQLGGIYSPDGSFYGTLTDGNGNLTNNYV